jgi:hypothetical protein
MALQTTKNSSKPRPLKLGWPTKYKAYQKRSISSLTPRLEQSGFEHLMIRLEQELFQKDLQHLKIEYYFGDEWFCPEGTTAIAIPFWLATKALKEIERDMIGFVEGESENEFMRLLRHEAGHCVEHAYKLSKTAKWKKCFGNPAIPYDPDRVKTSAGHPDFVENLGGGYAQTHPEEDFAETFAVWLDVDENCWERYRHQPKVLEKLMCIEELMRDHATKKPKKISTTKISQARRMRRSLSEYYQNRIASFQKTPKVYN